MVAELSVVRDVEEFGLALEAGVVMEVVDELDVVAVIVELLLAFPKSIRKIIQLEHQWILHPIISRLTLH